MKKWKHQPARDHGLRLRESFGSLRRESGLLPRIAQILWWTLLKSYLLIWHNYRVEGREHLPQNGPFIMVANHCSHFDVIALAAALPFGNRDEVLPVAAADTFFSSAGKTLFSAVVLNALPMWRKGGGTHLVEELRSRILETQCVMIIFPEGTRSRNGSMGEFRPGIGKIVAGTSVPVVPCCLTGCFETLPPDSHRINRARIIVKIGQPQVFEAVPNDRGGWQIVARQLQQAVHSSMS